MEHAIRNEAGILLICGPPAIGKSTFAIKLNEFIWTKSFYNNYLIRSFMISYDKLIDKCLEAQIIDNNEWKSSRNLIIKLVKCLVDFLLSFHVNLENFKNSINLNIEAISPIAFKIFNNFILCVEEYFIKLSNFKQENKPLLFIILLDDIFYYESMRYYYYKLAVESRCYYMSVCFKTSNLDMLYQRNSIREPAYRVDESSIEKILNKFEYPDDLAWEKEFSLIQSDTFDLNDDSCLSDLLAKIIVTFKSFQSFQAELQKKFKSVDISAVNVQNLVHECDLVLRKLITNQLALKSKSEKASFADKLNEKRKRILSEIRSNNDLFARLNSFFISDMFNQLETELKIELILN